MSEKYICDNRDHITKYEKIPCPRCKPTPADDGRERERISGVERQEIQRVIDDLFNGDDFQGLEYAGRMTRDAACLYLGDYLKMLGGL